jgi:hypothetical protein
MYWACPRVQSGATSIERRLLAFVTLTEITEWMKKELNKKLLGFRVF